MKLLQRLWPWRRPADGTPTAVATAVATGTDNGAQELAADSAANDHADPDVAEFQRLQRYVHHHLGHFALGLVRVNDPHTRDGVVASLSDALARTGVRLLRLDLSNRHPPDLQTALSDDATVQEALHTHNSVPGALGAPDVALALTGLEHLIEEEEGRPGRPPFGAALNQERDGLPRLLSLPLLLFLTDHAMDRLDAVAPDFFDWYSGVFRLRTARGPAASPGAEALPPDLAAQLEALEATRSEQTRQGDRVGLAATLRAIGDRYAALPQFHYRQAAIPPLKAACEIFHETGVQAEEAATLEALGTVCFWINDYRQASRRWRAALPIYRAIGDRLGEANCIQSLGDVHVRLAEYGAARQRYEEALPIYRAIGQRLGEANCIRSLGDVHVRLAEVGAARQRYEEALPIFRAIGDRLGEANCIQSLGDVHVQMAEYGAARQRYEEALPIFRAIGQRLGEANCIQRLGDVHVQLAEYGAARQRYEEALPIFRAIGQRLGEANCIQRLGDVHVQLAEYGAARQRYEEALPIFRAIGQRLGEANATLGIARATGSAAHFERALNGHRAIGSWYNVAVDAWHYGAWLRDQGDYDHAVTQFQEVHRLFAQLGVTAGADAASQQVARTLALRDGAAAPAGEQEAQA